jgi:hypothetical protein
MRTASSPTAGGIPGSGGRTIEPASSIQMTWGMSVTPKRASMAWVWSISDGWVEAARSTQGRATSGPAISRHTSTTSSPWG